MPLYLLQTGAGIDPPLLHPLGVTGGGGGVALFFASFLDGREEEEKSVFN